MPRSERDIFDDHVVALTRQLGVHLEQLDDIERRRLLDEVHHRRLNDHEAALTVAFGRVGELLAVDVERARVLVDRIGLIGRQWREQELVAATVLEPLERAARGELRHYRG